MRIESFQFHDRTTGWQLEETRFDAFNLLVGVSGVGKTRILRALGRVQEIALGSPESLNAEWRICFEHEQQHYEWHAVTSDENAPPENGKPGASTTSTHIFVTEKIASSTSGTLVLRDGDSFFFGTTSLPRLKPSDSAITLLAEEPRIAPLRAAFRRLVFSESIDWPGGSVVLGHNSELLLSQTWDINKIRDALDLSTALQAYLTQEHAADEWGDIKALFIDIFSSVADIKVDRADRPSGLQKIDLTLLEKGTSTWISSVNMSSGMRRTLVHLIDIFLAPAGTVILIDEFENSLGKNCMPQLMDFILSRAPDLQFIITSHHPYIINNLPISTWKLVQRRGSRVSVLGASDIPELRKASHHEAFDRLLNLPEYEQGIA